MQKAIILILIVLLLAGAFYIYANQTVITPASGTLQVIFYDVGQGDCILIDRGDYECLIDAGESAPDISQINGPLEDFVTTHAHADHIGGVQEICEQYEVKNFWYNGYPVDTRVYRLAMSAAEEADLRVAEEDTFIYNNDGLIIKVLHSGGLESVNNKSVVLEVTFGESSFVFMGDAETEVETHLIEELKVHDIDVLKVGHHGSCTSSSFKFLEAARPNIAVYSAGVDNTYGHPCVDTINRLTSLGCTVYGTDQRGTIVVSSDSQAETVTFL